MTLRFPWRGLAVFVGLATATALSAAPDDWPMFGANISNTASTSTPGNSMSPAQVAKLKTKWVFTAAGDVSARAAVVGGAVYFPDWGGNLWALDAESGHVIWSRQIADYFGQPAGSIHSRTSPAVVGNAVYVGTQEGAYFLAISADTGKLIWKTQLESADPYAIVTCSPTVVNNVVYTGVASIAEGASLYGVNIATSVARGSVVALNAASGQILWKTYTVPAGYLGGGVWGSSPAVDLQRGSVFVGTGDNYAHPQPTAESVAGYANYGDCLAHGNPESACLSPNDHVDSILALDMHTGAIKWARRMVTWHQFYAQDGSDDWNVDCLNPANPGPQCPGNAGPDYDFGSAPNEITYSTGSGFKTIIGAGQKSGIYYALDPDTGADIWQTQVGPGSALGGIEWGSASDGKRIYVAIANLYGLPYAGGNAGSWSALDPATGKILWQVADPNGSIDLGPMTAADGVVYAGSMAGAANAQTMFALDAATGATLWSFPAGGSVIAGAAVANEKVFWGSGYTHIPLPGFTGTKKFYAFGK